ncbi:MAG: hypothetical protein ACYC0O_12380 [Desulfurivibrionaceae bacterium]|jgi:hypothetical protein
MSTSKSTGKSFSDSALIIAFTTGVLFAVGYLHEGPFLEKFGLKSEEFIPDSATLITLGFKYLFVNYITITVSVLIALLIVLTIISILKEEISSHFKNKNIFRMVTDFKFPIIISIIIIALSATVRIIKDGTKKYDNYLRAESKFDVLMTKKHPDGIKGYVIRFHDNKIAFFDKDKDIAIVIPDTELVELQYSVAEKQKPQEVLPSN